MNRYLYVPLLAVTACAAEPSPFPPEHGDDERPPSGPLGLPGMETQGRYILGAELDTLPGEPGYHFSVLTTGTQKGIPVTVELFDGAGLRIAGTNQIADDVILPGAAGGEILIDHVSTTAGATLFDLQYRRSSSDAWTRPCEVAAAPLHGSYSLGRVHEDTVDRISFACDDGVAFKCIDWGYRAGSVRASDAWQLHQACTRMAGFDYCATGETHTFEGTYIAMFDDVVINPQPPWLKFKVTQWPPPPGGFYFEAGWRGENLPAVCLSKLRWQRFPLGDQCGGALPDPRLNTGAKFCDDYVGGPDEIAATTGARLFSGSRYTDLAMHTWQRPFVDRTSSIDGYYADPATTGMVQPYQGLGQYNYQHTDGLLIRSLPISADPKDFLNVDLYANGSDLVYATKAAIDAAALPHVLVGWRGMVLGSQRPRTLPLKLYQDSVTGDTVSTTQGPPSASYQELSTIGYMPALEAPQP